MSTYVLKERENNNNNFKNEFMHINIVFTLPGNRWLK